MAQHPSDFRAVAESVLRTAEHQHLTARDWGDGICVDFSDGLDALCLGANDLYKMLPTDEQVKTFWRRFYHLDRRRTRVLLALRRLWHESGAELRLSRTGYGSVDAGTFCSSVSAGWQLTRRLETHSDLECLIWIRGSFLCRLSAQEMQSLLERQDSPPPLAAEETTDVQPIDEAEWAEDLEKRYPHLETVFLPTDQLPTADSETLKQAEIHAHGALKRFQKKCSSRAYFLARTIDPPWFWLTRSPSDQPWIRSIAEKMVENRDGNWWHWLAAAEVLITLNTDLEPTGTLNPAGPASVPNPKASAEHEGSITVPTLRHELGQKITAWWNGGGHDIQDHLHLLGLFPELEELIEEVLEDEEYTPHARSLLRWHLPTRRSMAIALEEASRELLAAKTAQLATLHFDHLHQLCFAIGPHWSRFLIPEKDLGAIENLLLSLAKDLPIHTLSMELVELAKMAGLFRWRRVAESLIARPDLPSLLFSIPWQSLQIGVSDSQVGHRFAYSETLLGLVNAIPSHPQLRDWIAFALHLETQYPEDPSLWHSDAIPPEALLAMAWNQLGP